MKTIWKFEIDLATVNNLMMPKGADLLTAQYQRGCSYIWAEVDTDAELELRTFAVIGTGREVRADEGYELEFFDTFQSNEGHYVWHVYERTGK